MALFPIQTAAEAMADIAAVNTFTGLPDPVWTAVELRTGAFGNHIRVLAMMPGAVIHSAVSAARYSPSGDHAANNDERALSPVEAA